MSQLKLSPIVTAYHIFMPQNEDDLFFAQGYVHAYERLWQMELNRRICSGRLSEIFGDIALETDRFARRLGMHRAAADAARQQPEHSKRILEAYYSRRQCIYRT